MKTKTTLLLTLCFLFFFNCKNTPEIEYKHSDKKNPLECNNIGVSMDLIKEAVYTFEDDIIKFPYDNPQLPLAYSQISTYMTSKRKLPKSKISDHTLNVLEALKQEKDLWVIQSDGKHALNYNHPIIECIGNHIKDEDIKATFNALVSTNSMTNELITPAIRSKIRTIPEDKAIATFIALNTFYSKLYDMDFSKVKAAENNTSDK